jgi:catechol 2,3-dioxygenase
MRPTPVESISSDVLRYGAVHLDVTDVERSLVFWRDLIGMTRLGADEDGSVRLGVLEDEVKVELVVLHPGATQPVQRGYSALYHLAIHTPSEAEFARILGRLFAARYPNAPTDHLTHWATYLDDPDGINVEIVFETIDRVAEVNMVGGRPQIIDSQGRRHAMTEPLDLEEVFSSKQDDEIERPLPAGCRIGHVHLYVGDLDAARSFYRQVGFTPNMDADAIGFADLSLGGSFPHRIAVNIWQGAGAPQAPAGTAGMRHLELRPASNSALDSGKHADPSGNVVMLLD